MGIVRGANAELKPASLGKVFGARWYKNSSSTTLERLDDATGKFFTPSVGNTPGASDFDDEPIFRDIRLCNVVNGAVTAYYGDAGFSRTPASGDVMVEIPRYYYKIEDTDTYRDFLISDQPLEGFSISPRHAPHSGNAEGYKNIYVSAYTLNSSYRSISGNSSIVNITKVAARNGCKGRGTGYYQYDFATYWTIGLLYIVEVADWDSQSKIGYGYANNNTAQINTGGADDVTGHSGRASGSTTESKNAVKYRYMENLWGNIWVWCDGINFSNTTIYLCTNPVQYADDTASNYSALSYSKATSDGWIKGLGFDVNFPWAQIPTDNLGVDGTYLSDYYFRNTGWCGLLLGGYWGYGKQVGLWCFDSYDKVSSAAAYFGCRLIVLP